MCLRNVLVLLASLLCCIAGQAADAPAQTNASGDCLPPGAVGRLGTVRYRHGDGATAVAYSPDGKILASSSLDRTVRLWASDSGKTLHTLSGHKNRVYAIAGNLVPSSHPHFFPAAAFPSPPGGGSAAAGKKCGTPRPGWSERQLAKKRASSKTCWVRHR
jgi:hypothetical protein